MSALLQPANVITYVQEPIQTYSTSPNPERGERMLPHARVPNDVIRDPSISFYAKALYTLLASHAGNKEKCFPSIIGLASELNVSPSWVKRYLAELEAKNLIKTIGKPGRKSVYALVGSTQFKETTEVTHDPGTQLTGEPGFTHNPGTQVTHDLPPGSPMTYEETLGRNTREETQKKKGNLVPRVSDLELPDHLSTEEFRAVFAEWIEVRSTMTTNKPVKDWVKLFASQLRALGKVNHNWAVAVVENSIGNNYQGVNVDWVKDPMEPKSKAKTSTQNPLIP